MGRLIDADNITYESIDSSDTVREEIKSGCGRLAVRKEDIDAMPTIEERKKGKWIELDFTEAWEYKCDQCGRLSDFKDNFCPYCGADMRGDNHETP